MLLAIEARISLSLFLVSNILRDALQVIPDHFSSFLQKKIKVLFLNIEVLFQFFNPILLKSQIRVISLKSLSSEIGPG